MAVRATQADAGQLRGRFAKSREPTILLIGMISRGQKEGNLRVTRYCRESVNQYKCFGRKEQMVNYIVCRKCCDSQKDLWFGPEAPLRWQTTDRMKDSITSLPLQGSHITATMLSLEFPYSTQNWGKGLQLSCHHYQAKCILLNILVSTCPCWKSASYRVVISSPPVVIHPSIPLLPSAANLN